MNRPRAAWLLAAFALALFSAPSAVATEHEDAEIRDRTYDVRFILRTGQSGEVNMLMQENGRIEFSVRVADNRAVYLDLHSHVSEAECEPPAAWEPPPLGACYHFGPIATASESSTFIAPTDGTYSLMFERRDAADANVHLTIRGEFGIDSTPGISAIHVGPGPGIIAVLAMLGLVAVVAARRGRHA